ncbi:hypothetical protein ACFL1R_06145 [Candidatus Latescibacterota bacterium]
MKSENKASGFLKKLSRRSLFKSTGFAALAGLAGCGESKRSFVSTPAARKNRIPIPTYTSIGVQPVINCAGTMTHLGGSLMPPEVIAAMVEAGKNYISLLELMDCVGQAVC